jgi:3-oxoacyl-[acyl-carrier-protein] synthase II
MRRDFPALLPSASILGVGAVTPQGRTLPEIQRALAQPPATGPQVLRVSDSVLVCPTLGARLRRADRFVRMAVNAALDAWTEARQAAGEVSPEEVGLILASGLGSHVRGFRFLDGILDFGDGAALPTDFSHSLHGAASAYIAELLGLRGPSLTITDFENGTARALLTAQLWLARGRCRRVLVGVVEELGEVLLHCANRLLGETSLVPGEGAVFLALGPEDVGGQARLAAAAEPDRVDLLMLDDPPLLPRASVCSWPPARHTTTFTPYFGHSAGNTAFQLLGGLLALRAGRPLGRLLRSDAAPGGPDRIDSAAAFVPSSMPDARLVLLTRSVL